MVFYRKYRPQTIEELDSIDVRDKLLAVLSKKEISHAFLFTGPKGLGKTSAARIVAKAVNCESKLKVEKGKLKIKGKKNSQLSSLNSQLRKVEPCNNCHQCISITNGTNIDVLEIDGASNRGIDEIRDLREKVRLSAAGAAKKVYIIDEVHMLTTEAFNALLKTLEEPPSHVVFILCTTEPHKVPATIASRCFHIAFKKAKPEELVRSFKRIRDKEKLNIAEDALTLIANLSDGSFRDGAKILEEMALVSNGKKITKETVESQYKISNIKYQISEMIRLLSERDTKEALQLVGKLVEKGVDFKYFIEQIISDLHEMLLREVGVVEISNINPSADGQKSKMGIQDIKELVELLVKAHAELKYAVLPQLPLEMVLIGWGSSRHLDDSSEPSGNTQSIHKKPSVYTAASFSSSGSKDDMKSSSRAKTTPSDGIELFWKELIDKVKLQNHSIAGVLRGCSIKSYNNDSLVIETGFKFHKERLDDEKTRVIIENVCKEIAGKPVSVGVSLKES